MAKDVPVLVGSRIRDIRKKRRISQDRLAEKLDTTRGYISRVEHGAVTMGIDRLMEFCRALEVTPLDLLRDNSAAKVVNIHEALRELLKQGTKQDLELIYKLSQVIIFPDPSPEKFLDSRRKIL